MTAGINLANWIGHGLGQPLTHLRLQKLCFYGYGAALAFGLDSEIGEVAFEPWQHGPVNRDVWLKFRGRGAEDLSDFDAAPTYSPTLTARLQSVLDVYGKLSAWEIREQSHLEQPWIDAWNAEAQVIDPSAIRAHFTSKLCRGNVQWPELLLRSSSYGLDGVPSVGYQTFDELASAVRGALG